MGALRRHEGERSAPDGAASFKVISLSTRRQVYSNLSFEVPRVSDAPQILQTNFRTAVVEKVIFLTSGVERRGHLGGDIIPLRKPEKPVEPYRGQPKRVRDLPVVKTVFDWWRDSSF